MKRPYAAGVAILAVLLLGTVVGAQVDWVELDGSVKEPAQPALQAPAGAALASPVAVQATLPEHGLADGMPLDYVYINQSATGTNVFPWYPYYTACRFQMMYTASEIGRSGVITQMSVFKTAYTYRATFPNTSIKLCHTTVSNVTTNYNNNYGGNTPTWVYHSASHVAGTGTADAWDTIDFQTNFTYDGTSNLLVEVTWAGSPSGTYPGSRNSSISPTRRVYGWNDTLLTNGSGADAYCYSMRIGFQSNPNDVGVTKIISPSDPFYAFGDTFYMQAEVKNFGIAAQTGVPVICRLREKVSSTVVYDETLFVDLGIGATETLNFPGYYAPPATEAVYVDTMWTELPGDQGPTNDMKANEAKVTEWGSECLSYHDGTFDNAISWVAACNELTARFFAPVTPLAVNKCAIWLSSFSGNDYAAEIRLYGNDGSPYGYPGTQMGAWTGDLHTSIWTSLYYNEVMFDPAISVTYDTFFVSYYQTSITPAYPYCGLDYTPPVTTNNDWGKYNGTWGIFPYDGFSDFGIEACYQAPLLDGTITDIPLPPATIDSGASDIYPQIVVKNVGLKDRSNIPVEFYITPDDPLDPSYYEAGNSGPVDVGQEVAVDFVAAFPPEPGTYTMMGISSMPFDTKAENDTLRMPLYVRYVDVRTEIVSPRMQEVPGLVPVRVKLVNNGTGPVLVPRVDVTILPGGYADWRENIAIGVGEEQVVTLNPWVCPAGGNETCTAWITFPEDMNHGTLNDGIWNDTASRPVRTGIPGWTEMTPLPAPPSGKAIKDGGCMAYDAGNHLIYASKGYKTGDFYAYDVNAGSWTNLTGIPLGAEGKPVYKGSVVCSDGNGKLYLTKGNNTVGFWEYDAVTNAWTQKTNVPTGASGKKVKQGAGIAWAYASKLGHEAAYLLKGYRNEFYRFDPMANGGNGEWTYLLDAPIGTANHVKWNDGSWLVADADAGNLLYAFKSKYHEFYTYDTDADTWSKAKNPMPIPGSAGNKKAKTGSCAAWYGGKLYAFKGGNTNEFWRYYPMGDSWHKQDDIPLIGMSGSRKKVKAGAALAGHPGTGIYGFKGNKSLEFWRYTPYDVVAGAQPRRDGITAGAMEIGAPSFAIAPNPLAGGFATVRYSLPKAGLATLNVFDVTGRTVLEQTLAAGRTGSASLDLRKLEAGVYLVKVTTEGFSTTQKLVVEH
jgi:hypothetical protein